MIHRIILIKAKSHVSSCQKDRDSYDGAGHGIQKTCVVAYKKSAGQLNFQRLVSTYYKVCLLAFGPISRVIVVG
jgi:hypothetical protein